MYHFKLRFVMLNLIRIGYLPAIMIIWIKFVHYPTTSILRQQLYLHMFPITGDSFFRDWEFKYVEFGNSPLNSSINATRTSVSVNI